MKPTPAQIEYLENAREVCDAGTGEGNYFHLWGPGLRATGQACLRNVWILMVMTGNYYWITPAGRAVLEAEG